VDHSPGASAGEPYFCRDPGPQASPSFRRFLRSLGEARPSSILSGYLRVADQEIIALRECVAPLKPADLGTSSSIATWLSRDSGKCIGSCMLFVLKFFVLERPALFFWGGRTNNPVRKTNPFNIYYREDPGCPGACSSAKRDLFKFSSLSLLCCSGKYDLFIFLSSGLFFEFTMWKKLGKRPRSCLSSRCLLL